MATLDWTWRTTDGLPAKLLLTASRTEYDDKAWLVYKERLVPAFYRMLGDPRIVGLSARTNDRTQTAWSMSAWYDYDALESFVQDQIKWLSELMEELQTGDQIRHNAYRTVKTQELPPSWVSAEHMISSVMRASPLGADAFPELSHLLGTDK